MNEIRLFSQPRTYLFHRSIFFKMFETRSDSGDVRIVDLEAENMKGLAHQNRTRGYLAEKREDFDRMLKRKNRYLVAAMRSPGIKDDVIRLLKGDLWTPRCEKFLAWWKRGASFAGRPKEVGPLMARGDDDAIPRLEWPLAKLARERTNPLCSDEFVETVVFAEVMKCSLMKLYGVNEQLAENIMCGNVEVTAVDTSIEEASESDIRFTGSPYWRSLALLAHLTGGL